MKNSTFKFDFDDLNITVSQIEQVIGYNEGDDRTFVNDISGEILNEARTVCNIKAQYTIIPSVEFNNGTKSVKIADVDFLIKNIVYGQLKKSDSIAVFLCTAGEEIGIRSRKAMGERDLLKGYIYDVIGSEIVEAAADLMQNELETSAGSSGLKITNRYSPGYCGWDVSEQHKLFRIIHENYCGIRLTPSALMDPVKSVSGFIGIGENVRSNPYTCKICDMRDCIYRKVKGKRS